MIRLEEIAQTFETSRPVFRLTMERNDSTISMNSNDPVHKYEPTPVEGDVLSELVCSHYNERFDMNSGRFVVDASEIAQRAMSDIRSSMAMFLEKNLEMKNPRQSKIYRWYYRSLPNGYEFNDAIVLLYKYMRSFSDENLRASNTDHLNNAIAVMEAIMEKHDNE